MANVISQISISALRHRVTIEQRPDSVVDAAGDWTADPAAAWPQLRTVYAGIDFISARDMWQFGARYVNAQYQVTIRYLPDLPILDTMRLNWNGLLLEILGIEDVEARHRFWVAYCRNWQL